MSLKNLKELIKDLKPKKDKRNMLIASVVAGIIIISLGGTLILHNKIDVENKEVATSNLKKEENKKSENKEKKEENKTVNEEEAKKKLEELKNMDKSNLTEEEKKETEEKIKSIETMIENKEYERAGQEVATIKNNIAPNNTTSSNSNTSTKKEEISNKVEEVKKETLETKQNTNTGSSEKKEKAPKPIEEKKHNHKWVDITEEIHHPEEGHWEEVVITPEQVKEVPVYELQERAICNGCGTDITGKTREHLKNAALKGDYKCGSFRSEWREIQIGTKREVIPAVTERKWVVDKPAWTETKVVSRKCIDCGANE